MAKFDITNTATADHGLGLSTGETLTLKPGQTETVDLSDAEVAELDGHGWAIVPAKKSKAAEPKTDAAPAA